MLAKVRNLPPLSAAALELASLLTQPEINNEEIVRVLKHDSVLTARLLRTCNSPTLGLSCPIASVDQAVLLLGHRQIFQMVMAISVRSPMTIPLPGYNLGADDLWRHSLLAATAAEAAVMDGLDFGIDSSVAFTIGLLHDIGKLVTSQFLTAQSLLAIRRLLAEGRSVVDAERVVLGTDHAEVGAGLIYLWRLPDAMVEAVALHHQPRLKPLPRLSALAWFANRVAHMAEASESNPESTAIHEDAQLFEALGYNTERLQCLLDCVCQSSEGSHKAVMAA